MNERITLIEKAVLDASASSHAKPSSAPTFEDDADHIKIQELILQRRELQHDQQLSDSLRTSKRKDICKEIQRLVRRRTRLTKRKRIGRILAEFRGLKQIQQIKGASKNMRLGPCEEKTVI